MPNYNGVWSLSTQYQNAATWNADNPNPAIGLFAGGFTGSYSNVIESISPDTAGNGTDFGNLSAAKAFIGATGSGTRALFGGGTDNNQLNVIDFVTFATAGNASDFGDLTQVNSQGIAACASSTRGLFGGGKNDVIAYVTIASAGDATDFGDLTVEPEYTSACSSTTRGVFGGGTT